MELAGPSRMTLLLLLLLLLLLSAEVDDGADWMVHTWAADLASQVAR